jgi:multidrug efflux system outer membrane protein
MRVLASVLVLASLALSGCTLLPAYERPEAPVAVHWPQGEAYAHAASATLLEARRGADIGWQALFRDPALQQLIGIALENNRDLRTAALNVEAFRAQYRITHSERLPSVGLEGSGSRQRVVESLSPTGKTYTASQYGLGVGISAYELDFFGRVRSLSEAALQAYLGTEEAQRSAQIGLVGDVALAWLAWRTDQAQLELAQATLDSYQQSLQLMELSAEAGVLSALEVRQARTLVLQAQAQVAYFVRQVAQDRNGLELLLGTTLPAGLPAGLPLGEALLAEFPIGLPSDLLVQRPDIRAAERRLLAANADIGAARAAFFPSIRLTASAGTASN